MRALLPALAGLALTAGWAGSASACAPAGVPGGEWRSYGHDYANTRSQPSEKVISPADAPTLSTAWTFSTVANGGAGDITGTPVIADGCMYVATTRGWVFAADADTGKLVWKAQVPYGGGVNSSVGVGERVLPAPKAKPKKKAKPRKKAKHKKKKKRARRRAAPAPRTAGTIYVAVTRTAKGEGCPSGEKCQGPYVAAFDQQTGALVWATPPIDEQPGADVYGSPVLYDGMLLLGVSGGSAELGDEADRYAFEGSMNILDATTGRVMKKLWTIHPPKAPDDAFAGAGIWSTPAVDPDDKVAFAGTANPFKPQAEHAHANSVVRIDLDRRHRTFGEITGSYKGLIDEYLPGLSEMPCSDIPGNPPPYYPQGIGSCGDIDLDFGASPNLFRDATGRRLVGAGQKSGVYHVFDARTMQPVWKSVVGPPTSVGGIVGSTAIDGASVYGPVTVPGYVWSLGLKDGAYRWLGPVADGAHWGPPVTVANGIVYSVDFSGFLDAFDARSGTLLAKRPLAIGGNNPQALSWAGVSVARNTVYAAVGVLGLADGFVVAYRRGGAADVASDVQDTSLGGNGGGGGGGGPSGPSVVAGPGAASTGYATPAMFTDVGGPLSFVNLDSVQHDVQSVDKGPNGGALFHTKLIGLGESAPVEGLDQVKSGQSYQFFCSVHPGMRGTLYVR